MQSLTWQERTPAEIYCIIIGHLNEKHKEEILELSKQAETNALMAIAQKTVNEILRKQNIHLNEKIKIMELLCSFDDL